MDIEIIDEVLCACEESELVDFVTGLEHAYVIQIVSSPNLCMTLIKASDSIESQEFYLGEAVTMQCEVIIDQKIGYGICLGDAPRRAYCMAVIDAVLQLEDHNYSQVLKWVQLRREKIQEQEAEENRRILTTRVDFKLLEEN